MALIIKDTDVCEHCGVPCKDTYWIEITENNGEVKDLFVCLDCYYTLMNSKP
ncbi:MAG: hypothetical protein IJZ07_04720 [Clostridia bacterium]|nr:hypothetical protein [Clostridia bacterium]